MRDEDELYHYTSAAGLIGLLGTPVSPAAMWLTQVQYMNDALELRHAYELARHDLMSGQSKWPGCRRVMSGLWGVPYEGNWLETPTMGHILHRYCSFSLSEKPDVLSQWRGYVPEGGYAIGFRLGDLRLLAAQNGFSIAPCIYDDEVKHREISDAFIRIENGLSKGEVDLPSENLAQIAESERTSATARLRIQQWVGSRAPFYKHASFEEEREWRIVGTVGANDPRARWRARGSQVIPYCELDIGRRGPSPVPAISVVVGPGLDFELCEHAIKFMNFERYSELSLRQSVSTLRP